MIYEGIDRANNLIDGALNFASSKKETIVKTAFNAALLFIILLVFGCLDFATLTFRADFLTSPSYWGTVVTKTVAGVCSFNIGINLMLDNEIRKNATLQDLIIRYNKLKEKKQLDFEYYVLKVFNMEQKKKAYIAMMNKKIYRLNRFSKRRDRLLYSSELPEHQELKRRNRYCVKRSELEALRSEEYIEKNLEILSVKYNEVDPAIFELEIDGSPSFKGVKTKGNVNVGRAKASSSVILGMIGFSMFATAFALSADQQQFKDQMEAFLHYLFKALEDMFIVIWQTTQGMLKTRKIVSQQLTEPYAGRVLVLTKYLEWRLNNKIPDTKVYEEMKEKIIEVTEEEYEKMKSGV